MNQHQPSPEALSSIDQLILEKGRVLWEAMHDQSPGIFDAGFWQTRLLDWTMRDDDFRADLFRFVDILPCLKSGAQVSSHIKELLLRKERDLPAIMKAALRAASGGLASGLVSEALRASVVEMAGRFIAGRNASEALPALQKLRSEGVLITLDLLGEMAHSRTEAERYLQRYHELIDTLSAHWPKSGDERANISIKLSGLVPHVQSHHLKQSVRQHVETLRPLLRHAMEKGVFVYFDMEEWERHEITFSTFETLLAEKEFASCPYFGIVVQAYLKSADKDLQRCLKLVQSRHCPIAVRLVKGAYWDMEVLRARRCGTECPVFEDKASTDQNYEKLSRFLLTHHRDLFPAFASHNLRSLLHAIVVAEELGLSRENFEIQMLYGMAEPERRVLTEQGFRLRVYVPIGELLTGMAYLVRRLLENTSNSGFLRLTHHDHRDMRVMLNRPVPATHTHSDGKPGFRPCALTDWADPETIQRFASAIDHVSRKFPLNIEPVISGKPVRTGELWRREDPSNTTNIVSLTHFAGVSDTHRAIEAAACASSKWRNTPLHERRRMLEKLGELLQGCRQQLAALQCFEVGKSWVEADADVVEAIDFCRYYAWRAGVELSPEAQGHLPGEDNRLAYEGRGVCAVIAPWNFPLAILCGMAGAALVSGNPVILKPAEQACASAQALFELMLEAGFPNDVVHFLPGRGEEVGLTLVEHPDVATIAFTGSLAVGQTILEKCAGLGAIQGFYKKVICEMGGKNAIIVDQDADLDEALSGILHSAFGFAGQKCSAASRLIVHVDRYAELTERLVAAMAGLRVGPASDPACMVPPVIDAEACERLRKCLEHLPSGTQVLFSGEVPQNGYYVSPTLLEVNRPDHPLMQKELFGPILCAIPAADFSTALQIANDSPYALTAAVYSRLPSHLERARRELRVGNLYLNRNCTGAVVGRQPFGGFKLSGVGLKAGGPQYLTQFCHPRLVSENTVRRGFTPDLGGEPSSS